MDELKTLPSKEDTKHTPQEQAVMRQFFGTSQDKPATASKGKVNWKIVGCASVLFLLLANPWIDRLLCKIPYCGGSVMMLTLKLTFFALLLVIMCFVL